MWWHQQSLQHFSSHRYAQKEYVENDYMLLPRSRHTFGMIEKGEIVFESETNKFTAHAGEIVFIPQGMLYRSVWTPDSACLSCHFQFPLYAEPFGNKIFSLQKIEGMAHLTEAFRFLTEHEDKQELSFAVLSRFFAICDALFPLLSYRTSSKVSKRIRAAVSYLEEHFTCPVTVEELANVCCMSASHFHACFRKELGCSPIVYKNKLLCARAAQLLTDERGASVEEISDRLGFSSCAYFRRLFRSFYGVSPRDYRKRSENNM